MESELIKGYEKDSNITLLNVIYNYPKKLESGKYEKTDNASFIFYDFEKDKICLEEIENVPYDFYVTKKGINPTHTQFFMSRDDVEEVSCPYRQLNKKVAEFTDQMDTFRENIQNGNARANSKLHYDPRVLSSDVHIEDKLKNMFDRRYINEPIPKVTKAFFDIEYDGIDFKGIGIDRMATSPINAISLINEIDKRIYVFLLRNKKNPLIEEFERYAKTDQINVDLKDFIKDQVGGWKNEIRYGLDQYSYKFNFYDDEIELIRDLFVVMNWFKPTFVLVWNMAFDIPYIKNRIINLGYDPKDIMCHPDFKHKVCEYIVDDGKDKDGKPKKIEERGDFSKISSYSVFMDQMIQFASRRKGQSNFIRYTLDYIGDAICNVKKLDYSHITTRIAELPYKDYKTFVFYNIMDTVVQYCIDKKTADVEYVYTKALMNNVRYSKVHRQTTYQTTRMAKEFYNYYEDGLILGNNINSSNPKPTEKYPGAYVAHPLKSNDYSKVKVHGQPVNIIRNGVDYDYSAQYPNEVRENNMAPHAQIAKIIIDQVVHKNENPYNNKYYTRGGDFLEDYMTRSILQMCYKWFNLGTYSDLIDDVREHVNKMNLMYNPTPFIGTDITFMRRINSDNMRQFMVRDKIEDKQVFMTRNRIPDYSLVNSIFVDDYVYNNDKRYQKETTSDKNSKLKYQDDDNSSEGEEE